MESRVATSAASPLAVLRPGSLTAYWHFQRAVAKAQLRAWLPAGRRLLIDISGPAAGGPAQAAASGHTVVQVIPAHPGALRHAGRWAASTAVRPGRQGGGRVGQPGVPHRRLRGRRHRRGRRTVPAPHGRRPRRRDRPGATARRHGTRERGLAGAGHGHPRGAASLGAPHRSAARRGGAHPVAGWHHHPVLRPGATLRPADRGGPGGDLDPAAHGAVPVHRGSRASPAARGHGPAGPCRASSGAGSRPAPARTRRSASAWSPPPASRCTPGDRPQATLSALRSHLDWHPTQRAASGRASSRPSGIGLPQSAHTP